MDTYFRSEGVLFNLPLYAIHYAQYLNILIVHLPISKYKAYKCCCRSNFRKLDQCIETINICISKEIEYGNILSDGCFDTDLVL
jgi:hypothetical protein